MFRVHISRFDWEFFPLFFSGPLRPLVLFSNAAQDRETQAEKEIRAALIISCRDTTTNVFQPQLIAQ